MEDLTILEKTKICVDIANGLKNYTNEKGSVNLFNENYTFVPKLKKIFNEYIHGSTYFRGKLEFEEIGKMIEYHLPISKNKNPLFVIKLK